MLFLPIYFYRYERQGLDSNTCGLYYKSFRIIIYDRNDTTIIEPVL